MRMSHGEQIKIGLVSVLHCLRERGPYFHPPWCLPWTAFRIFWSRSYWWWSSSLSAVWPWNMFPNPAQENWESPLPAGSARRAGSGFSTYWLWVARHRRLRSGGGLVFIWKADHRVASPLETITNVKWMDIGGRGYLWRTHRCLSQGVNQSALLAHLRLDR